MTTTTELLAMAEAEQSEFVDLLKDLSADEWASPSLCEGLSVRDVVVHIAAHVHHEPSLSDLARSMRGSRSLAQTEQAVDALVARRYQDRSAEELVAWLASPMVIGGPATAAGGFVGLPFMQRRFPDSRFVQEALGWDAQVQLSELMIHQQDIRRPLNRLRSIPEAPAKQVLEFSLSRRGSLAVNLGRRKARGLRLVATDVSWSHGQGPQVAGPLEALLMAVNGRAVALADLSGPGLSALAERVGHWSAKFATA